jgi:hypothetical protein
VLHLLQVILARWTLNRTFHTSDDIGDLLSPIQRVSHYLAAFVISFCYFLLAFKISKN